MGRVQERERARGKNKSVPFLMLALAVVGALLAGPVAAGPEESKGRGSLSDNRIVASKHLEYKLQYRVYLPPGHDSLSDLPVLYLADGQWYIQRGELPRLLDRMIGSGKIEPVIAVFLDNRDPQNLDDNRRNRQFFCNRDYINFVSQELTGEIDRRYNTLAGRDGRTILGVSFGGLNSACFGLYAHESFRGIAMQSPAMHPVGSLFSDYEEAPVRDLKILLTTGTINDNEGRARRLKGILEAKGYDFFYKEVPYGHEWANWKPLLDDVLRYYFAVE